MKVAYLEDLPTKCIHPGCNCGDKELYLHAKCHPHGTLDAFILDGVVTLICHECERPVVALKVASRPEAN